ncbi:MAG: hypothetical protein V8S89_02580, partial [Oscillospiraceae bacterium]
ACDVVSFIAATYLVYHAKLALSSTFFVSLATFFFRRKLPRFSTQRRYLFHFCLVLTALP